MISFKEPQFITGTSLIIISTEEYRELLALTEELEDFLAVEKDKDEEIESIDLFERLKEYRKKKYKNSQKYSVDSDDLKEIITTPMP